MKLVYVEGYSQPFFFSFFFSLKRTISGFHTAIYWTQRAHSGIHFHAGKMAALDSKYTEPAACDMLQTNLTRRGI